MRKINFGIFLYQRDKFYIVIIYIIISVPRNLVYTHSGHSTYILTVVKSEVHNYILL